MYTALLYFKLIVLIVNSIIVIYIVSYSNENYSDVIINFIYVSILQHHGVSCYADQMHCVYVNLKPKCTIKNVMVIIFEVIKNFKSFQDS